MSDFYIENGQLQIMNKEIFLKMCLDENTWTVSRHDMNTFEDILSRVLQYVKDRTRKSKDFSTRQNFHRLRDQIETQQSFYFQYCCQGNWEEKQQMIPSHYREQYLTLLNTVKLYECKEGATELSDIHARAEKLNKIKLVTIIKFYDFLLGEKWKEEYHKILEEEKIKYEEKLKLSRSDKTNKNAPNYMTPEKITKYAEQATIAKLAEELRFLALWGMENLKDQIGMTIALNDTEEYKKANSLPLWIIENDCELCRRDSKLNFIPLPNDQNVLSPEIEQMQDAVYDWCYKQDQTQSSNSAAEKRYRDRIIQYLVKDEHIFYKNLKILFHTVNGLFEKNEPISQPWYYDITDLVDGLQPYAQTAKDCYVLTAVKFMPLPLTAHCFAECFEDDSLKLISEIQRVTSSKENYLQNILNVVTFNPAVMETALIRSLKKKADDASADDNYVCVNEYCYTDSIKNIIDSLENISKDVVDIKDETDKDIGKRILVRKGQEKFISDIIEKNKFDLFTIVKGMVSERYAFPKVLELPLQWIHSGEDYLVDMYINATGFNVCVELLWGLDKICIYKDKCGDYKKEIDALIKEIARYIRTFGGETGIIVHQIFHHLKKLNKQQEIWKFSAKNPTNGRAAIQLVADILRKFDIEKLKNEFDREYLTLLYADWSDYRNGMCYEIFYNNDTEGRQKIVEILTGILTTNKKRKSHRNCPRIMFLY